MFYETMSDMFIDNRNILVDELKRLNASKEIIEEATQAYDYAAQIALEIQESYTIVKEATIKLLGKDTWEKINQEGCKEFMRMGEAANVYFADIENGKKVGYSAEE